MLSLGLKRTFKGSSNACDDSRWKTDEKRVAAVAAVSQSSDRSSPAFCSSSTCSKIVVADFTDFYEKKDKKSKCQSNAQSNNYALAASSAGMSEFLDSRVGFLSVLPITRNVVEVKRIKMT